MASWICQTKKILSTVISSLSEDLEQTVHDFNDVIDRMNSSSERKPPVLEQETEENPFEGVDLDKKEVQNDDLLGMKLARSTADDVFSKPLDSFVTPTTRQSETFDSQSASNPSHSKSLSIVFGQHIFDPTSIAHKESCKPVSDNQSVHSSSELPALPPCFMLVSLANSKTSNQKSRLALTLGELQSKSTPGETGKDAKSSLSVDTCPCHQKNSLKSYTQGKVVKHPGKVVRANTLTNDDFSPHISQKGPLEVMGRSSRNRYTDNLDVCCDEPDKASPSSCNITTSCIVERKTSFSEWTSIRPLKRMLSFALAQLQNLVLFLVDESPYIPTVISGEINSVIEKHNVNPFESPKGYQELNNYQEVNSQKITSRIHDTHLNEGLQNSTFLERTYSTESFVIIDAASFDYLSDEEDISKNMAGDQIQNHESQTGCEPDTFCKLSKNSSDSGHAFSKIENYKDIVSQSLDYFNFDFRKLVNGSQFDYENSNSQNCSLVQNNLESNLCNSCVVVENSRCSFSGTNEEEKADSRTDEERDDDDCESIASFIILSDENEDGIWFSDQKTSCTEKATTSS